MCIPIAYMIFRKNDEKPNGEPNVRQVPVSQPPTSHAATTPGENASRNEGGSGGNGQ